MTAVKCDRRSQIICAALQVIAQQGIAQITTRKIARAADIRLATLHYYFESKDDLLLAVLDEVTDRMIAVLCAPHSSCRGLHTTLAGSVAALYALIEQTPYLPRVRCELMLYLSRATGYPSRAADQQRRYTMALQALYRDACSAAGTRSAIPLDLLATLVASQVDGLALYHLDDAPADRFMGMCDYLLQAALTLVEGTPGPGARA